MSTIALDGLNEEDFRRSIENSLREGQPGPAVERLRALLEPYAGAGKVLPGRFLTVSANDLVLSGWSGLEAAIARHDRPGRRITALSVAFGWPGEETLQPDAAGNLRPLIEVGYFNDDAFPFSHSARDDLLDGYSIHGCTWAADCAATDNTLTLEGIDDLHGALAALEARLLASDVPDEEGILAGSLGSCLLSALLFQAVSEQVERDGLPRPLCVMAGSSGVYPYFDAPVAGFPEEARKAADAEEDEPDLTAPAPRYSSLLMTGVPRAQKRAVLVLEESEQEMALRLSRLRGLNHADEAAEAASLDPAPDLPAPPMPEAAPGSPLLAKKVPGQAWDFRDMLGPPPVWPESEGAEPEQPKSPEVDWSDDTDWPEIEEPEAFVSQGTDPEALAPLEPERLETPDSEWPEPEDPEPALLDMASFEPAPVDPEPLELGDAPAPELPAEIVKEATEPGFELLEPVLQADLREQLRALLAPSVVPEVVAPVAAANGPLDYDGPYWPAGPGWLEEPDVEPEPVPRLAEPAAVSPNLWARLRGWLKR